MGDNSFLSLTSFFWFNRLSSLTLWRSKLVSKATTKLSILNHWPSASALTSW